jgi:ankyrin repeat protein
LKNNEQDQYGRTVAHYCASLGKTEILRKIVPKTNIDIPDQKGRTPLHYAVMRGHSPIVDYLIDQECDIISRDKQGYSPLMWACQCNQVNSVRRFLSNAEKNQKLSALLAITDNFGWAPIHKAAQVGNLELVRLFVEDYEVDPYIQTSNRRTPYDLAETTKASEVLEYLRARSPASQIGKNTKV